MPKPRTAALAALTALGLLAQGCCADAPNATLQLEAPPAPPTAPTPEIILAQIEDHTITLAQVDAELERALTLRRQLGAHTEPQWERRKRRLLLEHLIERQLLTLAARERQIKITNADIDLALDQRIERTFQTRDAFHAWLDKTQRSEADYRRELSDELLAERLLGRRDRLQVSDDEIEALYQQRRDTFSARERARVSVILLRVPRGASPDERAHLQRRAQELARLARARDADFEALARQHGEGPTAARGGHLGWVYANSLEEPLAIQAFRLPIGAVSDPVLTRLGYQIVKVLDRRPAGVKPLGEVRELLVEQLQQQKWKQARDALMIDLKRKHTLRVYEERLP
jgi:peptidyl-prolyl cis-trans isomerase SurA